MGMRWKWSTGESIWLHIEQHTDLTMPALLRRILTGTDAGYQNKTAYVGEV